MVQVFALQFKSRSKRWQLVHLPTGLCGIKELLAVFTRNNAWKKQGCVLSSTQPIQPCPVSPSYCPSNMKQNICPYSWPVSRPTVSLFDTAASWTPLSCCYRRTSHGSRAPSPRQERGGCVCVWGGAFRSVVSEETEGGVVWMRET